MKFDDDTNGVVVDHSFWIFVDRVVLRDVPLLVVVVERGDCNGAEAFGASREVVPVVAVGNTVQAEGVVECEVVGVGDKVPPEEVGVIGIGARGGH